MLTLKFDGPPSSRSDFGLGASETGRVQKTNIFQDHSLPIFSHPQALNPTTPTYRYFVLSPVLPASRDQNGGPSNSTIDIYDLTEKWGSVNSLYVKGTVDSAFGFTSIGNLDIYITIWIHILQFG